MKAYKNVPTRKSDTLPETMENAIQSDVQIGNELLVGITVAVDKPLLDQFIKLYGDNQLVTNGMVINLVSNIRPNRMYQHLSVNQSFKCFNPILCKENENQQYHWKKENEGKDMRERKVYIKEANNRLGLFSSWLFNNRSVDNRSYVTKNGVVKLLSHYERVNNVRSDCEVGLFVRVWKSVKLLLAKVVVNRAKVKQSEVSQCNGGGKHCVATIHTNTPEKSHRQHWGLIDEFTIVTLVVLGIYITLAIIH